MMGMGQVHGALWQLCTVGSFSDSWFYTAKSKAFHLGQQIVVPVSEVMSWQAAARKGLGVVLDNHQRELELKGMKMFPPLYSH